jgi:hypothetical protein
MQRRRLGIPDTRCPGPLEANVRDTRWGSSQLAMERSEDPFAVTPLLGVDVPDVVAL